MIEAPPLRIAFTVHGQPAPAGSKRHVGNGRIVDSSRRAAPWKNLVAEYAAQAMTSYLEDSPTQGTSEIRQSGLGRETDSRALTGNRGSGSVVDAAPLLSGPLAVKMVFYVVRPKAHFNFTGLRASAPVWPTTRPDVLKLARAVEDACTGIIWRDDAQIVDETLVKKYGAPARVEVTVMEA